MAREVERKFLVSDGGWRAAARPGVTLSQFYVVAGPDRTVRVRISNDESAVLTLKFGGSRRERDEFQYPIPVGEAREMERFAIGNVIEKTRFVVSFAGRAFEIDLFERALSGLAIAELETEEEVPDAELPGWLGREVTDDPAYYNVALAMNGLPETA